MGVKGIICFHVGVSIPLTISRCVWNLNATSYVPFSLHPSFSLPSCLLVILMYWEGLFIPILWILLFSYYSFLMAGNTMLCVQEFWSSLLCWFSGFESKTCFLLQLWPNWPSGICKSCYLLFYDRLFYMSQHISCQ